MTKASKASIDRRQRGAKVLHSLDVPDVQVELANPAALRAFHKLSRHGQAMLMAMIRWVSQETHLDDDKPVLGAAAEEAGLPEWSAREGVNELIESGLLKRTKDGTMVLHPLFSAIGHRLRRECQVDLCGGDVVSLQQF